MTDIFKNYFEGLTDNLLSTLTTPDNYLNKIALTAITIIISLLLQLLLKKFIIKNVNNYKTRYKLHKIIKSSLSALTALLTLFIWIQAINALVLIALLAGVFTVVMVRGLTNNIIGYFVIKYRKYFKVGHRIEINNVIGDVIEINSVSFKLLEVRNWLSSDANTGRVIKLPNKIIFDESIEMIGVTNTFVWHEIKYILSFDSHWQNAEKIMTDAGDTYFNELLLPKVQEVNGELPSEAAELQPVFSVNTNEDGIVLILRYMVHYLEGTKMKTYLQRNILTEFEENPHIKFATLDIRIFS